jgi:hypothetical protein
MLFRPSMLYKNPVLDMLACECVVITIMADRYKPRITHSVDVRISPELACAED